MVHEHEHALTYGDTAATISTRGAHAAIVEHKKTHARFHSVQYLHTSLVLSVAELDGPRGMVRGLQIRRLIFAACVAVNTAHKIRKVSKMLKNALMMKTALGKQQRKLTDF